MQWSEWQQWPFVKQEYYSKYISNYLLGCVVRISAIDHFFCVYIASSKHEEGWENWRQLYISGLHNFGGFSLPPGV